MPHAVDLRRRRLTRGAALVALALAACARTGTVRVVADSTTAPGGVEVLALRGAAALAEDPARLHADSLAARFAALRRSLVARADSLALADRRTPAYAAAYARYAADADSATQLRAERDSARRAAPPARPLADSLLANAPHAPLAGGTATLTLAEGDWWIAIADTHGVLVHAPIALMMRAGAHDTMIVRPLNEVR